MSHRDELERLVNTMSEAEIYTVLKFVQFLEEGHVRPRLGAHRELMTQAKAIIGDLVEIVDLLEQPEVELVHAPHGTHPTASGILEGAVEIPRDQWRVTLDGFSQVYHDLNCRLWVRADDGSTYTLAQDVPLGQVYFDQKGSERNAVQVALNRTGSVYSDFRFMHRIDEPDKIYLREADDGELVDMIIESAGKLTVLDVSIPAHAAPGVRRLAYLDRINRREHPGSNR